jgi:hypothetical protein
MKSVQKNTNDDFIQKIKYYGSSNKVYIITIQLFSVNKNT